MPWQRCSMRNRLGIYASMEGNVPVVQVAAGAFEVVSKEPNAFRKPRAPITALRFTLEGEREPLTAQLIGPAEQDQCSPGRIGDRAREEAARGAPRRAGDHHLTQLPRWRFGHAHTAQLGSAPLCSALAGAGECRGRDIGNQLSPQLPGTAGAGSRRTRWVHIGVRTRSADKLPRFRCAKDAPSVNGGRPLPQYRSRQEQAGGNSKALWPRTRADAGQSANRPKRAAMALPAMRARPRRGISSSTWSRCVRIFMTARYGGAGRR